MARKRTDIGELARALKAPAFGNPDAAPDRATLDPVSPTTLVLRISEIKAYEYNPRHAENREYPRLKESIRTRRGLTTLLTVTKRPGDELYTIAAGGNSRLRALEELAKETGDEAFEFVTCRFEPWDSECQVFANHLIENDVRGTMTFGDKARAMLEWQRLYEDTHPDEPPLSQRQLAEYLAATGYRVPRTLITPLLYTAELLLPHLPILFASGLGRPAAERLVRLRSCCVQHWRDNQTESDSATDAAFDKVFAEVCREQDCNCADWDHELFQSALTMRIAKVLGIDYKLVALDIDGLYHGYSAETTQSAPRAPDPQGLKSEWAFERSREIDGIRRERSRTRAEAPEGNDTQADRPESQVASSAAPNAAAPAMSVGAPLEPSQLRQSNYLAAQRLAASHGLDEFVKSADVGFGFFIEAPEPSAVKPESKDRAVGPGEGLVLSGIQSGLWWLLCLAADQLAPSHLAVLAQSYPGSWLVELFTGLAKRRPASDPVAALQLLVGEPTAQGLVVDVLTDPLLSEDDLAALNGLLVGCRAMRAAGAEGRYLLWDSAS